MAGLFALGPWVGHGQHWSDGLLPGADWSAAFLDFETTWQDSIPEKGKGFKPFMRWRHFAEQRFAFDESEAFHPDAPWQATKWERMGRATRTAQENPIWTRAVPKGLPLVGGAGRVNRVVVDPSNAQRWFACAPSGGCWETLDAGSHWNLMGTHDWAGMGVSDVALHPDDPNCILAATGDADFGSAYAIGLMRTCDGGASWAPTGLQFETEEALTCSRVHRKEGDPQQILVATADGIWLSEDDGESFTRTIEGIFSDLTPHPGDSAVWHAARRPGELFRSTDGGRNWTPVPGMPSTFLASRYALATSASDPAFVAALGAKVGSQGLLGIYLSVDSGATYTAVENLPNLLGWTVDGVDQGGQGFYDLALAIDPLNSAHMIAGGVNLWESFDAGTTWACAAHWFAGGDAPYVHADHHAVTFLPGSSDWISAHDGGVTRMGGEAPQDRSEGLEVGQVYAMAWSENRPGRLISGWQDNGVNLLKAGVHAQVIGADGFHCLVHPTSADTLMASAYFGKVQTSTDGGWSWHPWIGSNGEGVDEQGDWNTPMACAPGLSERVFVAKRRVYWTDDLGTTWNETQPIAGPPLEVMALAPEADSTVVVARGNLAFKTDNLETWNPLMGLPGLPIQDVLIEGNGLHYWMAFGGYASEDRVWFTDDGGASWTSRSEGLPALPVNTLALDEATGDLYAGTDAGVYVRVALSEDWVPYKTGLPEVICSDLGIRQSTGELLLATYGRGLWKAPLRTPPSRDAALVAIQGADAVTCSGPIEVTATVRNAGADTLLAVSLIWNAVDTVSYGMVLAPNAEVSLSWPGAERGSVTPGGELIVQIADVVGVNGNWNNGSLEGGFDALAENDVLGVPWEHRMGTGWVVMHTLADCNPMEASWALLDTSGLVLHRRQHFPIEQLATDSLCLSHGCFEVELHDESGNGFAGNQCGMQGQMTLLALSGDTIWSIDDSESAGIAFASGTGGTFCLPLVGTAGCTDETACNFNPAATDDDESCISGCAGPACPADLDGDGLYGATDILVLLSEFGCLSQCEMDITGDGAVSAIDILALLALYGDSCVP